MKTIISFPIILLILVCSLNSQAQTVSTIASGLGVPTGVAVDGSGNVFVTDRMIKVQNREHHCQRLTVLAELGPV